MSGLDKLDAGGLERKTDRFKQTGGRGDRSLGSLQAANCTDRNMRQRCKLPLVETEHGAGASDLFARNDMRRHKFGHRLNLCLVGTRYVSSQTCYPEPACFQYGGSV